MKVSALPSLYQKQTCAFGQNLYFCIYFFFRNHQQNVKVLWKRTCEAKRIYDLKCREEVASNQFYHQEVARCGKISKEAEKVSIGVLMQYFLTFSEGFEIPIAFFQLNYNFSNALCLKPPGTSQKIIALTFRCSKRFQILGPSALNFRSFSHSRSQQSWKKNTNQINRLVLVDQK